jgi:MATE family multidrug resistance protein
MNREILRLAIPNILSNISVPLLSTFDTALMGRLSAAHIAAVGIGSMLFNFIYWNFGFLRMGSTGLAAQAFGREDRAAMAAVFGRAGLVALGLAALLLLAQTPLLVAGSKLLAVSPEQAPLVTDYFRTRIWAAPAALLLYGLIGWFFGAQNAVYPLVLTLVINFSNIGLSVYFVRVRELEATGVALGTVGAQYIGLALGLAMLLHKYGWIREHLRWKWLTQWNELRAFFRLNRDIFIRTLCLTLAFGFFYNRSNLLEGGALLAANVILLQYLNWMSYGVDGFAYAAESLVGKYSGARNRAGLNRAIRYSFGWGMVLALGYTLIYGAGGDLLLRVFTDEADVIAAAQPYLLWMAIFPILATPCYIWDGVFIGLTAASAMRNTMLLAFAGYLGSYYAFAQSWGNHGLWFALLLFMVLRGGLQWGWYRFSSLQVAR